MRKKDLLEENQALLEERDRMMDYIRRLERERYHLRGLMMIDALDEWLSDGVDAEPVEETPVPVEVKVRGFAPQENNGGK